MSVDLHHGDRVHLDGHTTPGTISSTTINTHGITYNVVFDDGAHITDIPAHNLTPINTHPAYKTGDRVKVIDNRNRTQPGRITNTWTNPTNTYDIALDNGDEILDIAEIFLAPETIHDLLTTGTRVAITLRDGETHYGTIEKRDTDNPSFYGIKWDDGTHSTDHADDIKILPADDPKHTTTTSTTTPRPLEKSDHIYLKITDVGPISTGIILDITHYRDGNHLARIEWDTGTPEHSTEKITDIALYHDYQPRDRVQTHDDDNPNNIHTGIIKTITHASHSGPTYIVEWDDGTTTGETQHTLTPLTAPHPKGTRVSIALKLEHNRIIHGTIIEHLDRSRIGGTSRYRIQWDPGTGHDISTEQAIDLTFHTTPTFTPLVFTPRQD